MKMQRIFLKGIKNLSLIALVLITLFLLGLYIKQIDFEGNYKSIIQSFDFSRKNSKDRQTHSIGKLGGVKLSIPKEYQLFSTTYKGEDIWSGKRLEKPPTFDTPISTTGLFVRLPNMEPKTAQNTKERSQAFSKHDLRYWVSVQIEGHGYKGTAEEWVKMVISRKREGALLNKKVGWKYQVTNTRFGLIEENLIGGDIEWRKKKWLSDKNLMYDDKNKTFIQCNTNELKFNSKQRCRQSFSLRPRINAHVWVRYNAINLKDWKEIQSQLTNLIYSFIVE